MIMDSTVSLSKGTFLFKNGWCKPAKTKKTKLKTYGHNYFNKELWNNCYTNAWSGIEAKIQELTTSSYNRILTNLVAYVKECHADNFSEIENTLPTATLLTGVNQPDHLQQFETLANKIRSEVTPHLSMVSSQDGQTLKHLIERVVHQFVSQEHMDISDEDSGNEEKESKIKVRHCNIKLLKDWYEKKYSNCKGRSRESRSLVIILQDFESFNNSVLQDFISILSNHTQSLPMVLIFGVATSAAVLHKCLPYHVSSKLLIKVFQSQLSNNHLNQIVEEVILNEDCPFHLSGKVFQLLVDVFLFYDFSVSGFIQSFKYCMMEHFYEHNFKSLCTSRQNISKTLNKLNAEDLEHIRRLPSFRPYVEKQDFQTRISLLKDDSFLKHAVEEHVHEYLEFLKGFHIGMKLFYIYYKDLPKKPFGNLLRELYTHCSSKESTKTEEYKECLQLINFQSKELLIESLQASIKLLSSNSKEPLQLSPKLNSANEGTSCLTVVRVQLALFLRQLQNASMETMVCDVSFDEENTPISNRHALKKSLLKATKHEKIQSEFEMVRSRLKQYLDDIFQELLQPFNSRTFHEIFVFEDLHRVKRHIVGAPRGAIHNALNDPAAYLQCKCCEITSTSDLRLTFLDVCIAYKLHAECGKHINLYDWLQAFIAVVQPEHCDENRIVSPELQVRFTRAVSELQFLGFIKASKRKTDHVLRLTW